VEGLGSESWERLMPQNYCMFYFFETVLFLAHSSSQAGRVGGIPKSVMRWLYIRDEEALIKWKRTRSCCFVCSRTANYMLGRPGGFVATTLGRNLCAPVVLLSHSC
jgi:hypothetical protein